MVESIVSHLLRSLALLLVIGAVLVLGWNEPLSWRFGGRPVPVKDEGGWMYNRQTALDKGPYNQTGGGGRGGYRQSQGGLGR